MKQSSKTESAVDELGSSLKCSPRSHPESDQPFLRLLSSTTGNLPMASLKKRLENEDAEKFKHKDYERQSNQTPEGFEAGTIGSERQEAEWVSLLQNHGLERQSKTRLNKSSVLRDNAASYFINQAEVDLRSVGDLDVANKSLGAVDNEIVGDADVDVDEFASQQVVQRFQNGRRPLVRFSETNSVLHLSPHPSSSSSSDDDVCSEHEKELYLKVEAAH